MPKFRNGSKWDLLKKHTVNYHIKLRFIIFKTVCKTIKYFKLTEINVHSVVKEALFNG